MNRRANFPLLVFAIGALLVFLAFLMVVLSLKDWREESAGDIGQLSEESNFIRDYLDAKWKMISESEGEKTKENIIRLSAESDFKIRGTEVFFGKIAEGDFKIEKQNEGYKLSIENVSIFVNDGYNGIKSRKDFIAETGKIYK